MSGWYAVFCKPRGEITAHLNLVNQGYQVYLPRLQSKRRKAGKWIDVSEPLFPRYLFVRPCDAGQSLSPVRSTLGVSGIVRFGTQPAVVSNELIDALRMREDPVSGACVTEEIFTPGGTVRFLEGPFAGLDAVFSKKSGDERVVVLLDVLGKTNSLKVNPGWLMPCA